MLLHGIALVNHYCVLFTNTIRCFTPFTDAAGEATLHSGRGAVRAGHLRAADAVHRLPAQATAVLPGLLNKEL